MKGDLSDEREAGLRPVKAGKTASSGGICNVPHLYNLSIQAIYSIQQGSPWNNSPISTKVIVMRERLSSIKPDKTKQAGSQMPKC